MLEARKIANFCVTLGSIGFMPFGGVLALCVGLPIAIFLDVVVWTLPSVYPGVYLVLAAIVALLIAFYLRETYTHQPAYHAIVVNRVLGFSLALSGISIHLKFLLTTFILYLILRFFLPRLLMRYAMLDVNRLPAVLALLVVDVGVGFLINFFFRFAFWLSA